MCSIRKVLTSAAILLSVTSAAAQTSFTYQGRLDRNGAPEPGIFDLQFRLFTAPQFGIPLGPTICSEDVVVADDGTFTTTLDFGTSAFTNPLYLEIAVRPGSDVACSDPAGYEILPRQALTGTPVAINAQRLNNQTSTFFTNASNINSGLLADARLSSNIPRLNRTNAFDGAATFNSSITVFGTAAFVDAVTFQAPATFVAPVTLADAVTLTSAATYSTPLTRIISFGAASAQPASNIEFVKTASSVRGTTVGTEAMFYFPIVIPNAASIAGVTAFVSDNSTNDFTVGLDRSQLTSGSPVFVIISFPSAIQSFSVATIDLSFPPQVIDDNQIYTVRISYTVPADPSTMRIHGISVTYTINATD